MNERVPSAVAVVASLVIIAYACTTTQTTANTNPSPTGGAVVQTQRGQAGAQGGFRGPMTDSARRVRDSLTSARRDSGAAMVLRSIAGHENQPAESVFKNIKIFKGVPAARLVDIMNHGFGRSLGVSCGFCHVPGKWDLDDKEEKNTARLMFAMVQTINRDFISRVPRDSGGPQPNVGCFTCHRGEPRPLGGPPGNRPPGGPPPGSPPPGSPGVSGF